MNTHRDQQRSWEKREERLMALAFLAGLVTLYVIWHFTAHKETPARLAAIGGTIATFGAVVLALPVLRVGVFQYIANTVWHHEFPQDYQPELADTDQGKSQRATDQINQNVFGPGLVAIGTIVNGFSGLF